MSTVESVATPLRPVARSSLAAPRPGADGHRLLGPALGVDRHLGAAHRAQRRLVHRQRASCSASTSRAACRGTCRLPTSPSTRPATCSSDNGISVEGAKIQERNSDSGDIIKVQVGDQPPEVREELQEAFAEAAGRAEPADVSVASVSATWGAEITRKAVTRPDRVPRPDRDLHLVALRVADGADGDHRHGPRRRRQRRHLLDVRLRGHAGDGRRVPDRARLLAVRLDRRVRPHPGQRAAGRRGRDDGRRPHQRLDEPGADALDQHDAGVRAAGDLAAADRRRACSGR